MTFTVVPSGWVPSPAGRKDQPVTDNGMPAYIPTSLTPVAVTGTIRAQAGRAAELEQLIKSIVPLVRAEQGYEEYSFHTIADQPGTFTFYERWSTGADLVRHAQQPFMLEYFGQMPALVEPVFETTYLRPLDV